MGVWVTPYAMPAEGHTITHDDFTTMILRVLHEGHGRAPVTVASGLIAQAQQRSEGMISYLGYVDVPKDINTFPHHLAVERVDAATGDMSGEYGTVTIWYRGDDRDEIAHALAALPYGREDVWVKFDGGWDDPEFYALAEARPIGFWNAWVGGDETYATTAHACELAGEKGRDPNVYDYAISAILAEYYGPEMRMGYTYS